MHLIFGQGKERHQGSYPTFEDSKRRDLNSIRRSMPAKQGYLHDCGIPQV